ncbi:MAG TPA: Ig-like domain-containing protein [Gemmatimonadaceae bacterium]|nr:Ig-like domain-containing protein [Gemmatimonadaceae bacterium]
MRRSRVFLLATLAVAACTGDAATVAPPPPSLPPVSVTVSVSAVAPMTAFGETRALTAVVRNANQQLMPDAPVTWTIDVDGRVTLSSASGPETVAAAAGNGSVGVTASSGGITSVTHVLTVRQMANSLTLSPAPALVFLNETQDLSAAVFDANGNPLTSIGQVAFSSSNTDVAPVAPVTASVGRVTGLAEGTATITASYTVDGVTASATSAVTVATPPAADTVSTTSVRTFDPATAHIAAGGSILWRWISATTLHNVTFETPGSPANIPDTNLTTAPDGVSRDFPTAGTFSYRCTRHAGMNGSVVVH